MLAPTAQDTRAEQRAADILASIRGIFAEKGFDGASMQDLARAAGMSVGNFYRYFPSKSAIVQSLIALDLEHMQQDFAEVMTSPTPIAALRDQARSHICKHQDNCDGQLWAEISAAATRKPEIGQACLHMDATIAGYLLQVFARETGLSLPETTHRFTAHANYIVVLVKAAAMLAPQDPTARASLNGLILQTIDQTLAEVSRATVKDV